MKKIIQPDFRYSGYLIRFVFIGLVFSFIGCASGPLMQARDAFYSHRPMDALNAFSEGHFSSRDKLLVFMEKGLILHYTGKYEESVKELLQASELTEQQDIISVSQQTLSLITTEWITEYKGESSERLWIHTYLMMNFLMLYKYESALVEAKKALKILEKHSDPLSGDYFTRAMIALCYENLGEINDAYIEYKRLAKLTGSPSSVAFHLYRLGRRLGFRDEAEQYRKFIPSNILSLADKEDYRELVLFVGMGAGPVKFPTNIVVPPSIRFSFPEYKARDTGWSEVRVFDSARPLPVSLSVTTSINTVAEASLKERANKIIAKETVRATIKEAMSQAVERKNEEIVGVLLRAALFLLEEPDTRCWETLPAALTLVRVPITRNSPGITVQGGRYAGKTLPDLNISPGQKVYHSLRFTD